MDEQLALRLRNRLAVTTAGEPSNAPQERRNILSLRRGKPEVSLPEAQDAKPQCEVFELQRKWLRRAQRFVQGLEQCQGLKHPEDARLPLTPRWDAEQEKHRCARRLEQRGWLEHARQDASRSIHQPARHPTHLTPNALDSAGS